MMHVWWGEWVTLNNERAEAALICCPVMNLDVSVCVCLQEFFDLWPVLMGEVPPYDGPKTPDGRVRTLSPELQNCTADSSPATLSYPDHLLWLHHQVKCPILMPCLREYFWPYRWSILFLKWYCWTSRAISFLILANVPSSNMEEPWFIDLHPVTENEEIPHVDSVSLVLWRKSSATVVVGKHVPRKGRRKQIITVSLFEVR